MKLTPRPFLAGTLLTLVGTGLTAVAFPHSPATAIAGLLATIAGIGLALAGVDNVDLDDLDDLRP